MNERYLVIGRPRGRGEYGGRWGSGETAKAATLNYRKAGGSTAKDVSKMFRFTSELPFAPTDREATDAEADCWVGGDGAINWVRCEREEVTKPTLAHEIRQQITEQVCGITAVQQSEETRFAPYASAEEAAEWENA